MSELPFNWEIAPISDVTVECAQRIPSDEEQFQYIDIASIDRDKKSISSPQRLFGKDAPSRARKHVFAGDVLVSMTRPNLNAVALVPDSLEGQIASTGFDVLRAPELDPRWLYYVVRSRTFVDRMSELVQGALYPAVRSKDVRGFKAPFAPLNEQKRIADKLDSVLARVDACREHLDRVPAILKCFRKSVLAAATSGKLTEEWRKETETARKWRNTVIGTLLEDIRYGTAKKCRYEPKKTPVLRIPNVLDGQVNHADMKYADFGVKEIRKLALVAGDILMIRSNGSLGLVGRTALVSEREEGFAFAGYLIRLRVNQTLARPAYISFSLMSPTSRDAIELVARSTSGVNNINTEEIKALAIRLPCIEEQQEIVRRVESLFAYADRLEACYSAARAKVERLTAPLLAKAFRGELIPQDPSDEPASVLLERIRAARETTPTKAKNVQIARGAKMTKVTAQSVKDLIPQLPDDRFTFDDLRARASTDYETLKEIVFDLLSEAQPIVKQVFDTEAKSMRFVRVNQ